MSRRVLVEGVQINEWAINLGADGGTTTWFSTKTPVVHDYPDGYPSPTELAVMVKVAHGPEPESGDRFGWEARHAALLNLHYVARQMQEADNAD